MNGSRPVAEGVVIGLKYAIGIAKLAQEYDKPIEYVIATLEERKKSEEES